jgi:hypothetical protein
MPTTDFTGLDVGTTVVGGVIEVCPKCGKNGVAMKQRGGMLYKHAETTSVNSATGQSEITVKGCPVPEDNPRSAKSQ